MLLVEVYLECVVCCLNIFFWFLCVCCIGWFFAIVEFIGGSSNGRTAGFGPADWGSSPCSPVILKLELRFEAFEEVFFCFW